MTLWLWPSEGRAVLELCRPEVELVVFYGDGTTRAAWCASQSGRVVMWANVGVA